MHNYKNNLFLYCISKPVKWQYGFSNIKTIAALLILGVIISGILVIMNRGPEISQEGPAKTDTVEVARDVGPEPQRKTEDIDAVDNQSPPESPAGSEDLYSEAEKATEEGDVASARELTSKAFELELGMAIERRVTGDSTGEMGDTEKKQFLAALKRMWSSHKKISEAENSTSGTVEATIDSGPSGELADPIDHYPPQPPSDPVCGDGICEGSETNATCPSDCPPPEDLPTCCGGYTLPELEPMYYEDEGKFWQILWACNDLEACY